MKSTIEAKTIPHVAKDCCSLIEFLEHLYIPKNKNTGQPFNDMHAMMQYATYILTGKTSHLFKREGEIKNLS